MKNIEFLDEISKRLYEDIVSILGCFIEDDILCINFDYIREFYIKIKSNTLYLYNIDRKSNKEEVLLSISMKNDNEMIYRMLYEYFNNIKFNN